VNRRDFLGLAVVTAIPSPAQTTVHPGAPSPEAFFNGLMRDRGLQLEGEDFCWHAAYSLHGFVQGYEVWRDTAWLDQGLRYYDFLLSKLRTGPDGYLGWIGPYEYDNSVWCDVHVGDAILFNGLVGFSELVLADPSLRVRYAEMAHRYVDLARKHLFEKWDSRGTWFEDGPYGAYRSWNRYGDPANLTKAWPSRDEIRNSMLALPFNKQDDIGAVALKLYRITGEQRFRDRAERIFAYHKSRLNLVADGDGEHYVWNYWEPYGTADLDLPGHKCRHWVGTHPERPYQQGEVANIVDAYHTGVVFDETDIRRILNTNLKVMWNGSLEAPAFRNSNATFPGVAANPKSTAGVLWSSLADFDETIRKIQAARLAQARGSDRAIERAYFEKVTLQRPPGFERRKLKGPAKVFDYPMNPGPGLIMAAALPSAFSAKEGTLLACESLTKGAMEIAQYSADGKRKLATLRQTDQQWFLFHRWTGMTPGSYRIRWSFEGGGYREAPVTCT
jgi:hypothetical protein